MMGRLVAIAVALYAGAVAAQTQLSLKPSGAPLLINNCNLVLGGSAVFCEPFDVVNTTGNLNRTGALDPNVWGVSRTTGWINTSPGFYNGWTLDTDLVGCTSTTTVQPPNDVIICNGQLREAIDDNPTGVFDAGTVVALAMYPKQPFDWAGRTGTVSFDVSDDSDGSHGAWPEFWISDLPVPAPFAHFGTWHAYPQYGFGIRFDGYIDGSGMPATCPEGAGYIGVGGAILVYNYVGLDTDFDDGMGLLTVTGNDCVLASSGPGNMNHFEIKVSLSQIDVYGTDAGVTPTSLNTRHLATILTNQGGAPNLGITRGLIWIEDVHYNADKGGTPSQRTHTFSWDNVAFDGPFPGRDFTWDAPDALVPDMAEGTIDLGQFSAANTTSSWSVPAVPSNTGIASGAHILYDFIGPAPTTPNPTTLKVIVNGNIHTTAWPYPDTLMNSWRTYAFTVPLTDFISGTNTVQIGSDADQITSNVNIQFAGVAGAVPVLPGNSRTYP